MTQTSATSERQQNKAKERRARDVDIERRVIESLMVHAEGRRWVWLRIVDAQVFVEGSSLDPQRMAFDKGARAAGLALLAAVTRWAPRGYITMTTENAPGASQLQQEQDDDGHSSDQ